MMAYVFADGDPGRRTEGNERLALHATHDFLKAALVVEFLILVEGARKRSSRNGARHCEVDAFWAWRRWCGSV